MVSGIHDKEEVEQNTKDDEPIVHKPLASGGVHLGIVPLDSMGFAEKSPQYAPYRIDHPQGLCYTVAHLAEVPNGGMAEWFKALVLKTNVAHRVTVGSNPTPSAFTVF